MSDRVMYFGREIPKAGFRAWVYGTNDAKMLANSWEQYEELVASGVWFSSKAAVPNAFEPKRNQDTENEMALAGQQAGREVHAESKVSSNAKQRNNIPFKGSQKADIKKGGK